MREGKGPASDPSNGVIHSAFIPRVMKGKGLLVREIHMVQGTEILQGMGYTCGRGHVQSQLGGNAFYTTEEPVTGREKRGSLLVIELVYSLGIYTHFQGWGSLVTAVE